MVAGLAAFCSVAASRRRCGRLPLPAAVLGRSRRFLPQFWRRSDRPEINRIAHNGVAPRRLGHGFAGQGCRLPMGPAKNAAMEISSPAISAYRPITLMCWFRWIVP